MHVKSAHNYPLMSMCEKERTDLSLVQDNLPGCRTTGKVVAVFILIAFNALNVSF